MKTLRRSSLILAFTLGGCADAPSPVEPGAVQEPPRVSSGAAITETEFFATAMCAADIGFDIYFRGQRVLVRHVSGNDETFSFRTQDFMGWRMPESVFTGETADFDVVGGAEMFNIKRNEEGSFHVRIHEGTLRFESLTGTETVLARHSIRLNPGQGEMVSEWRCKLQ